MFGLKKPKVAPAPVMPLPDDEEIRRAKRLSIVRQMGRSGRSSTILTTDALGG
jgi:hypothetical protein